MSGIKERLIITLRFIYDISFIHLLLTFVTYLIIIALENGYLSPGYSLLNKWLDILIIYKNEFNLFYHALFIFIYNFIDWLLNGKYHIFPKLVTKLIKGRVSLILKTFVTLLILLYLTALFVGMYITNQEEKVAEELRIAKEIQLKKEKKAAEEERIAKEIQRKREAEQNQKEIIEQIQKERLSKITYPFQGLSCKHVSGDVKRPKEDIILILKRNNDKNIFEIDLRTRNKVIDGVIYNFETIFDSSIKITEAEIEISLKHPRYDMEYNLGTEFFWFTNIIISRSSLKLTYYNQYQYQCRQVDYEDLYDFVKKHNATITDKNKL